MSRPVGSKNKVKKPCKKCGGLKRNPSGSNCVKCKKEYDKEYRTDNSMSIKQTKREDYLNNKESRKSRAMDNHFKKTYGLTSKQVQELKDKQQGLCALCKDRKAISVDHCHKTGRVRGVLCRQCNTGIGQLNDDPKLLKAAVRYLS